MLRSWTGEVSSNSIVPFRFSSAKRRMLIMWLRNKETVPPKPSNGRIMNLLSSHLHCSVSGFFFVECHAVLACDLFELVLSSGGIQRVVSSGHFDQHQFGPARPALQIVHRIRSDKLALVDDDDPFTGLLDLRQYVRAQNNRVVAGETLDQVARLVDLFRIQSSSRFVQNEHVWIVNEA